MKNACLMGALLFGAFFASTPLLAQGADAKPEVKEEAKVALSYYEMNISGL